MSFIVRVYANWCGHCQAMEKDWKKLKSKIGKKIQIYDIEEEQRSQLEEINNMLKIPIQVSGYPTIAKSKNGFISYYSGPRILANMISWALPKTNKTNKNKNRKNTKRKKYGNNHIRNKTGKKLN